MTICIINTLSELDKGFILTPERYNPSRRLNTNSNTSCTTISELIQLSNETITAKMTKKEKKDIYLINTGDANEGYIKGIKKFEEYLNSTKKVIYSGDVIISRLRPYLRQVAYVDQYLPRVGEGNTIYAVSTEFFILRSKTEESIAFLVPFLLSNKVQDVFSNSVEGSQHPRFKEEDLLSLVIPNEIIKNRSKLSTQVEKSIKHLRDYEQGMSDMINHFNKELKIKLQ